MDKKTIKKMPSIKVVKGSTPDKNVLGDVDNYNHPFHTIGEEEYPYGSYNDNEEYILHYPATSRYGYMSNAIYVVLYDKNSYSGKYKIFIGECPHKDSTGRWCTYNRVPSFRIGAFGGAHYIVEEPDIPHLVDIQTDEWRHKTFEANNDLEKRNNSEIINLKHQIAYCTLKAYLHGLKNRIKHNLGHFMKYSGEMYDYVGYNLPRKSYSLSFFKSIDGKEIFLFQNTGQWIRRLWLKRNGEYLLKYEKEENQNVCCGC